MNAIHTKALRRGAARPPRYRKNSRKSTGSVRRLCPLREGRYSTFETRPVSRLPILLATNNQAPKPPSRRPGPPPAIPYHIGTPFSDTHTTPNRNPTSTSQFLKPASSTSFPLDSLRTYFTLHRASHFHSASTSISTSTATF